MTDEQERTILERVAAGELTPEEGLARLDELRAAGPGRGEPGDPGDTTSTTDTPGATGAGAGAGDGGPPPGDGPAREIRLSALAGSVHIVGDPTVVEATAEGDYTMHRDGDVLVIEAELDPEEAESPSAFVIGLGPGLRRFGIGRSGLRHRRPLHIRMNPDLPLDLSVSAGSLHVRGVHAPIRCDVTAGNARLDGIRAPIDCSVSAGSLTVRGVLDHGESRINCDAGSVKVDLEAGSSVEVTMSTNLGKVSVLSHTGATSSSGRGMGDERHVVVGRGEGRLDVRANLGKILVSTPD